MKKLVIFSDTHGYTDPCIAIINKGNFDAVIHAGDCVRDAEDLEYIYPDLPIYYVKGNNDIFSRAPSEISLVTGGARIYVTHGHEQHVKYENSYSTLRRRAIEKSADLVIFGHTHQPYTSYDDGMTILNPGSVRFTKTYAVAEIENGKINTKILDI